MRGAVRGAPGLLLRAEGLAVAVAAVALYAGTGWGWGAFALLILAPDLAMLGYLGGPRAGAAAYNAGHSYLGPFVLLALGWADLWAAGVPLGLIWAAHIGADRALGYGLKYAQGFKATHLSEGGPSPAAAPASR